MKQISRFNGCKVNKVATIAGHSGVYEVRTYADYKEEVTDGGNECAGVVGMFTADNGKKYVIWYDYESYESFITEVA